MSDNLPCVFCSEHRARPIRPAIYPGNGFWWAVYCFACKASGPWQSSPRAARVAWESVIPGGSRR